MIGRRVYVCGTAGGSNATPLSMTLILQSYWEKTNTGINIIFFFSDEGL